MTKKRLRFFKLKIPRMYFDHIIHQIPAGTIIREIDVTELCVIFKYNNQTLIADFDELEEVLP